MLITASRFNNRTSITNTQNKEKVLPSNNNSSHKKLIKVSVAQALGAYNLSFGNNIRDNMQCNPAQARKISVYHFIHTLKSIIKKEESTGQESEELKLLRQELNKKGHDDKTIKSIKNVNTPEDFSNLPKKLIADMSEYLTQKGWCIDYGKNYDSNYTNILDWMAKKLNSKELPEKPKILHLASSTGVLNGITMDQFGIPLINSDINQEYLDISKESSAHEFKNPKSVDRFNINCDATNLSDNKELKAHGKLDVVISEHFLHANYSPIKKLECKMIEEVSKVLKPGGYLLIENATFMQIFQDIDEWEAKLNKSNIGSLRDLMPQENIDEDIKLEKNYYENLNKTLNKHFIKVEAESTPEDLMKNQYVKGFLVFKKRSDSLS